VFFPRFALALGASNRGSGVSNGLVSYWKMDEASSGAGAVPRLDSAPAGNTLTDNNTTPNGTGKIGNCLAPVATNLEFLSRASNSSLQAGDIDFTWTGWIQISDETVTRMVFGKNANGVNGPYRLNTAGITFDKLVFSVFDGSSLGSVTANTFGALSLNTWYFFMCKHDSVANLISISVNAGTADTQAWTTGTNVETGGFAIGQAGETPGANWSGLIDEVGFWKRALSQSEIAFLYNGGTGRTYPF